MICGTFSCLYRPSATSSTPWPAWACAHSGSGASPSSATPCLCCHPSACSPCQTPCGHSLALGGLAVPSFHCPYAVLFKSHLKLKLYLFLTTTASFLFNLTLTNLNAWLKNFNSAKSITVHARTSAAYGGCFAPAAIAELKNCRSFAPLSHEDFITRWHLRHDLHLQI